MMCEKSKECPVGDTNGGVDCGAPVAVSPGIVGDSRERFTEAAAYYDRYRPSYPSDLVDWLIAKTGLVVPATVADIGCGTGISSRRFAERGFQVTGIEPNHAMRACAAPFPR